MPIGQNMGASASPTGLSSQAMEPQASPPSGLQSHSAFTPGPWKVFRAKNGVIIGIGDRAAGGITDCGDVSTNDQGVWRSGKERDANANLIAASPDMFEALERVLNHALCRLDGSTEQVVRAAIAKARGESAQ